MNCVKVEGEMAFFALFSALILRDRDLHYVLFMAPIEDILVIE
jgi:hypothetical protein